MLKRLILPALIITSLALSALAGGKNDRESQTKKADYLFLEAQRQRSLDNLSAYYYLLEKAWQLDTTQTFIGSDLGFLYMNTERAQQGYDLMKRHFKAHPEDFYSALLLGQIANRLGDADTSLEAWTRLDSIRPNRPEIVLRHADAISRAGDTASILKAIAMVDTLQLALGRDINITNHKCGYLMMLGDTAAIVNEGRSMVEYFPQSADAHMFMSEIFNLVGQDDSMKYYIDKACELDGENGMALAARAEYFREKGDSVAYDRDVFNVLANTNMDISTKTEMLRNYVSELYQDTLQKPRILDMFNLMIDRNPRESGLRDLYGAYLSSIKDYNGAAEQFSYAQDLSPNDSLRAISICQLYLMGDSPAKAADYAREMQQRFPKLSSAVAMEGYAASAMKDYPTALQAFNRAIEMTSPSESALISDYYCAIGDLTVSEGDTIKAFEYYDKSLEINPDNTGTLNNYAYFLSLLGRDLDKAEEMSYRAVIQKPSSSTDLDTYAWILFRKKDFKKAKEYIDRALSFLEEDTPEIMEHAGDIYFFNGERDKAISFWERAAVLDPDNKLLHKKLSHKTYFEE